MRHAAQAIDRYASGISLDQFLENEEKQDAIIRRIEILGEAADRLMKADKDYIQHFPDLPVREIKAMRNFVSHGYDAVDLTTVWNTVKEDVPDLCRQLDQLINERKA
ncbi:MAG: DUF86 domain-containing protein [Beijerinckiaceae bacterium]